MGGSEAWDVPSHTHHRTLARQVPGWWFDEGRGLGAVPSHTAALGQLLTAQKVKLSPAAGGAGTSPWHQAIYSPPLSGKTGKSSVLGDFFPGASLSEEEGAAVDAVEQPWGCLAPRGCGWAKVQ